MPGPKRARDEASGTTYEVFISHAGPQKANFAVWLKRELRRHGISAFLDETNLRLGDAADAEMEAALRSCDIVVVVLTLEFIHSSYCMQELHWALHLSQPQLQDSAGAASSRKSAAGSAPQAEARPHQNLQQRSKAPPTLLPVFYHTSDINALQQDIEQQIAEAKTKGASSAALQQAFADLAELVRFTGNRLDSQGKLDDVHVDAIVAEVLRRLDRPRFKAPTYAVDLERRAQELLPLLQPDQPGGVRVLSLHGMRGIGKTTLARELFNRLSGGSLHFNSRIFLEVGQDSPLLGKQRQLIQLLAGSSVPVAGEADQQQQQLRRCTQHAGALLLVLDDIWTAPQRNALLCLDALSDGSRVVPTGRDSSNLHPDGDSCMLRPVELMAEDEARQLLCQHAFAATQAPPGYDSAVQQALALCGGLPLALQVVDAGMRSRTPEAAEDDVKHLLAESDTSSGRQDGLGRPLDVLTLLRWSFDRLPTDNHRRFFLDAALLMRNHPQEDLLQAWAGILQQQQGEDDYDQHPASVAQLERGATALWTACAGAALVSCQKPGGLVGLYSICAAACGCADDAAQSRCMHRP